MTITENKIFDARQTGIAILDMTEKKASAAVTGVIFKISVICGCQLPTHDVHIKALESEFLIFLNEIGYNALTMEEILTAFRMNSNFQLEDKIETYGTIFNIDFASKVLKQYRDKRWSLDRKLDKFCAEMETQKILGEQELKRRIKVKAQFEAYLLDETAELDLADCYMQLVHDDAFADNSFDRTFTPQAKQITDRTGLSSFGEQMKRFGIDPETSFKAGYLAVRHLFSEMKKRKRLEIYNDEWKLIYPRYEYLEYPKEAEY